MPSEYSELVKNVAKNILACVGWLILKARNSLIFEEVELLPSSVAASAYRLISYCVGSSPISSLSTLVPKVMMASEDLKTSEIAVLSIVNLAKEAKIAGEGVEVPSLLALLSICKSLIAGGVSVHTLFSFVYLFSIKSFVKLCLFCSSFD
ncbi:hypothetical protein LguiA_031983 [Lonicera macranthoides]